MVRWRGLRANSVSKRSGVIASQSARVRAVIALSAFKPSMFVDGGQEGSRGHTRRQVSHPKIRLPKLVFALWAEVVWVSVWRGASMVR